jgi:hypothetical protein
VLRGIHLQPASIILGQPEEELRVRRRSAAEDDMPLLVTAATDEPDVERLSIILMVRNQIHIRTSTAAAAVRGGETPVSDGVLDSLVCPRFRKPLVCHRRVAGIHAYRARAGEAAVSRAR